MDRLRSAYRAVRSMAGNASRAAGVAFLAACGTTGVHAAPPEHYFPGFEWIGDDPYCTQCVLRKDGTEVYVGRFGRAFAVVRMRADGTPDPSFGRGGIVTLPVWGSRYDMATTVVGLDDGRILVLGRASDFARTRCPSQSQCSNFIAIFRLRGDGTRDPTFDHDGRLILRFGEVRRGTLPFRSLDLPTLARLESGGSLLLTSHPALPRTTVRIEFDGRVERIVGKLDVIADDFTVAVEFHDPERDLYFATSDAVEAENLDRAPGSPWVATGEGFVVHPPGAHVPQTVPVCRFYGRPELGLDDHVLSANADECAALEADPRWILETRQAFRVGLPDPATGACAEGSVPVYRFWNAARGVGHRLVNAFQVETMRQQSHSVAEGWGQDGVSMCSF